MKQLLGWLIYDPVDIPRNTWFIAEMIRCAEMQQLSLRLVSSEDAMLAEASFPDLPLLLDRTHPEERPDFLINRSRRADWSLAWESNGIRVFNSAAVTGITNDKYLTYQYLHGAYRIPMAKTWQITAEIPDLPTPLVKKPADGHGGAGVTWISDLEMLKDTKERPFLLQEPMVTGWDVRLYVLHGEIYDAVLRTSDADFRSNFSLGGKVELYQPDAEMQGLAAKVHQVLPLDFAGVDILRHPDGGYVIGEIEDAVGCRMLYQLTDKNPVADYMEWIRESLRKS